MKIKLVAFDWNGTILSDAAAVVRCENLVLKYYGLKTITLKDYQTHFSIPIKKYWISMGIDPGLFDRNSDEIHEIFFKHYAIEEARCRTRTGSKEVLRWLLKNKIIAAVFSNHIVPNIEQHLKRLKLDGYIHTILARPSLADKTHMHVRHKEQKLEEFVRKLKIKPWEVMVVGDTDEEVEIGKKLGYHTVALSGGHQTTARLKAVRPDFLINNLKELKKIIS